jgi:hypothetical protein
VDEGRPQTAHELVCPHCKRAFEPQDPIGVDDERRGFKCPHCRLFVALERAESV